MKKPLILLLIFTLLTGVNSAGILSVGGTLAYYHGWETSEDNLFQAGALLISAAPGDLGEFGVAETQDFSVSKGGNPMKYKMRIEGVAGVFCNDLIVEVQLGDDVASGPLNSFSTTTRMFAPQDDWQIKIIDPNNITDVELYCSFKIIFEAWQVGWDDYNVEAGFSDTTSIQGRVNSNYIPPEEPQEPQPGDVVINEIMWMGSTVSGSDEWIELRNTTGHDIDIGQWDIVNARVSNQPALMIPANNVIPANGYFLIAQYPKTAEPSALNVEVDQVNNSISLANSDNGNLILRDKNENIIDQALGAPDWPEGIHQGADGLHRSMERNDVPGDGLAASNWHTCMDEACNDTTYWDFEGNNYGTPGSANLSENDPSFSQGDGQEQGSGGDNSESDNGLINFNEEPPAKTQEEGGDNQPQNNEDEDNGGTEPENDLTNQNNE